VPRAERRLILKQLPRDSTENVPSFKDHRLKPTKLDNWRRRYRDEVQIRPYQPIQGGRSRQGGCLYIAEVRICGLKSALETPRIIDCEAVMGEGEMNHLNREESMTENIHHLEGAREQDSIGISFMDMCQNGEPFQWSKVEVTGFPELLLLFKALRSEDTAPDQSFLFDEAESDAMTFLSNSELQELSSNNSHAKTDDFHTCLSIRTKSMETIKHRTNYPSPQYPWRDIQNVFCGYSTSPLNEIYVFPPCQESLRASKSRIENLWGSLNAEALELEMRLFKLEGQFGENNPAVIAALERLDVLYNRLQCFRKSELIRRRLVDVYCRVLGSTNRRTLQAGLVVVESLLEQGKYVEAQAENHMLRPSILKVFEHDNPLTASANYVYGNICNFHGREQEAEKYFRQHLQIMLSLHGPKAMATVGAMSSLSHAIIKRRPKESDILLRIAAQLAIELPRVDEGPCRSLRYVVHKLFQTGAYEESYCLVTKSLEWFSIPLGDQHPAIWKARERLAWNMSAMGNPEESVKILRAVISHAEETFLELGQYDANPECGLANALLKMGEIEEATTWYERAFQSRMKHCGSSNDLTLSAAYCLGYCYYEQGKYDEALNLNKKMVRMLHESGGGGRAISDFESNVLLVQEKIAGGHK
jgi:tetratricopeptide (TPR) repeat protein